MFNNVPIDVCTTAKLFDHCCLLIITLKRYRPTNRQLQYRSPYPISIRGVRWKDISVTEQCRTSIQIILLVHGYAALNLKLIQSFDRFFLISDYLPFVCSFERYNYSIFSQFLYCFTRSNCVSHGGTISKS